MITTEVEFLRRLCKTLGLLLLEESADGRLYANAKTRQELGEVEQCPLIDVIDRLVGPRAERVTLEEKVSKTRAGVHEVYTDGQGRKILLEPLGDKRVAAIITPRDPSQTSCTRVGAITPDLLAAGMSHELANAVGAIAGWAKLAREGQRVDEALKLIESTANTAVRITRQMLGRARDDNGDSVVDLSELAEEGARLLTPKAAQAGVTLTHRISSGLMVRGTRDSIWSILWNPLINAIEAMPHGGALSLELASRADRLRLVIEDTGPGMDPQTRERVFQPYFTTKPSGTGLGLALVKEAVEQLGGAIEITSARSRGTRVQIDLPAAIGGVYDKLSVSNAPSRRRISAKILVVDDDPAMRELIATALTMYGAEVVTAACAGEAIEVRDDFDLALVDVRLPDRSGETLLAELVAKGKTQSGLLVSGSDAPDGDTFDTRAFRLLRKPFQLDDLFDHVALLLEDNRMQQVYVTQGPSVN
jgi:signal transduction histidine kinase/ActR/RegA family two-component response regulator